MATPASIIESVSLRQTSPTTFETVYNPERMGNTANIAYGGGTLAVAVRTAYTATIPDNFHIYSLVGHYTGPVLTDRILICKTTELRRTRSFVTIHVLIFQRQDDGTERLCLAAQADFQAAEKASLLVFSKPPSMHYESPPGSSGNKQTVPWDSGDGTEGSFALARRYVDAWYPPESVGTYHASARTKTAVTPQDHLPVTSKTTVWWIKSKHKVNQQWEHAVVVAWLQDAILSFTPLMHSHLWLDDAKACSSLDFALRFFVNDLDLNEWHLREAKCVTAGAGRTYSEAQLWDGTGRMVSSMTQQNILRPWPGKEKL